jgi:hypothetical protein
MDSLGRAEAFAAGLQWAVCFFALLLFVPLLWIRGFENFFSAAAVRRPLPPAAIHSRRQATSHQ